MPSFGERLAHAWNAFKTTEKEERANNFNPDIGMSYMYRPDHPRLRVGNERSMITAVYNKIAIDVAQVNIYHARVDDNKKYVETIESGLNECLTVEANIDQTGRQLIMDITMSMFDEGVVAVVPVDTTINPILSGAYDIKTMRVGKILQWYPEHVKVRLYNEKNGKRQEITLPKRMVAIIENPLYAIMNEPNSTMQRLIRKLSILDAIDEQSGAGKMDLIIQLPYIIKTEARRAQAEQRRKDIEMQLEGSKYGIAYTDGTERITQLNRPIENNLMGQIEFLTSTLYSQLGITKEVFEGTADEKAMLNYYNRTVEPILSTITEEMSRKFLTKTARSQKQSIVFIRDPFKLVPVNEIAGMADTFTRNEIMSSNEFRSVIGRKPSNDPKADELRNKNLNQSNNAPVAAIGQDKPQESEATEEEENEEFEIG